jgi:citrate synthase
MIEDLAEHASFEDVAYLLLYGELPKASELAAFHARLSAASAVPAEVTATLKSLPAQASMMDVMRSGASLVSHWDPDVGDNSVDANLRKSERLLAQMAVVLATARRFREGKTPVPARADLSFAGNLLWMMSGQEPTKTEVDALNISLIMYAEHEYNASTFTARVVTSTRADMHSAVTAAIGALKGPLHGGANERVLDILLAVGKPENAEGWVREALAQKTLIMGFGHRVYKHGDVRAKYLKPLCVELATAPEFQAMERISDVIEGVVLKEKGLLPNLDWPSARIYHYLGLPVELFTPLFVVSRVTGWCAHIMEQSANNRLIRPRSRYTGKDQRSWIPADKR